MRDNVKHKLIDSSIRKLTADELGALLLLTEKAIKESGKYQTNGTLIELLKEEQCSTTLKVVGLMVNKIWRTLSVSANPVDRAVLLKELVSIKEKCTVTLLTSALNKNADIPCIDQKSASSQEELQLTIENAIIKAYEQNVGRVPGQNEIKIWKTNLSNGLQFHEFLLSMSNGPEAKQYKSSKNILVEKNDGEFIQLLYELIHGRGCSVWEINYWVSKLTSNAMQRSDILAAMMNDAVKNQENDAGTVHDGLSCQIMGTTRVVTADDWKEMARSMPEQSARVMDERYAHRFYIKSEPHFLVTAIASLYCGSDFIEQFMDNITSQSIFDDYCELVIVDADSPENEYETIKRYLSQHKGIHYIRTNYRIGIYDAWNVGAKAARGDYLTNTNMDDLRRHDSLELQAAVLDNLPFVDVTYQDLYYTFDPGLTFEEIAEFDYESNLPIITPYNLMQFNSPHNAPMWRKSLHEELGYFNTQFKSAGDYEFWMRCLTAGKCFYKLNDPHVVYYQNPKGLSTRPDTRGVMEAKEISKIYARKLVSENLVMPFESFYRENLPSVPHAQYDRNLDRYALTQRALRNTARQMKYAVEQGVSQ